MSNRRLTLIKDTDKCSCKGYNLNKLLQPNILALLATREMYGYLVIQELEKLDLFKGEKIDNTGIYRTLKHLEEKSLETYKIIVDAVIDNARRALNHV